MSAAGLSSGGLRGHLAGVRAGRPSLTDEASAGIDRVTRKRRRRHFGVEVGGVVGTSLMTAAVAAAASPGSFRVRTRHHRGGAF